MNLAPGIDPSELGRSLRMREFKVEKTEGDIIFFKGGLIITLPVQQNRL